MTISSAKAKYEGIKETYRYTVDNLNATVYNSSMLFQEVDTFNQNIHTNIIDKLDEFADNLRAIKIDESNYKNTVSKIGSLKSSVAEGRMAIDGYNTSISQKAIELFNEYTTKFESSNRLYEGAKESALKHINLAQDAQNNIDNNPYPSTIMKSDETGGTKSNPEYYDYEREWTNKRDTYLKAVESQLSVMEKNIKSMKELLDKGLKKV